MVAWKMLPIGVFQKEAILFKVSSLWSPCERSCKTTKLEPYIASRVSGLSIASPQVQRCLEIKHFNSGQIASGHLPLVHTRTRTTLILVLQASSQKYLKAIGLDTITESKGEGERVQLHSLSHYTTGKTGR